MFCIDNCSLKISLPLFIALLVVAQIDLASAAAWPPALLALLHLTPAPNDICRGGCTGLGAALDAIVIFQLARILARRALQSGSDQQRD